MRKAHPAMSDRVDQMLGGALSLRETGPGDDEEPRGENLNVAGLIPEADLPRLKRGANTSFGAVLGTFHSTAI